MTKKLYLIFIVLYTFLLLYWMFFGFGRNANSEKSIQLIPSSTIYKMFSEIDNFRQFTINILGNILLFIPFGFLGILFKKLKNPKFLLPVFILGISFVEFLQFISRRGFAEIDDVILNTIGVIIGFGIYKSFTKTIKLP